MIGFLDSFVPWTAATFIPALVGLAIIVLAGDFLKPRYLAAFAIGIFLWFFVDTIGGSASLDVNSGFNGGGGQISLTGLFTVGLLFFFIIDRKRNVLSPQLAVGKYGLVIPILVAASIGIHGLGEGAAFGGTASTISSTSLLDAFGSISAGVAYVLHKALEPMMIGACYCIYSKDHAKRTTSRVRDILVLAIIFTIPSLIGAATGYFLTYDSSFFFALGTGTSVYALTRLTGPLFDNIQPLSAKESVTIAVLIILGLLTIYFAALFHS
jgi:hypothetical protein